MILFALCAAILLCGASLFTYFKSREERSYQRTVCIYALITILAAAAVRYLQSKAADALLLGALLKFSASLPGVLFALRGYLRKRNSFSFFIFAAILIGMIADVSININVLIGGCFFLIGHLLYDVAFLKKGKPSKRQLVLWLIISILMILPLYLLRKTIGSLFITIGVLIYISILFSTVIFSWSLNRLIFMAAAVFALSDCFMVLNNVMNAGMFLKILALLVYYGSLLLYGIVIWKE